MYIKSSATIRNNYNEIAKLCKETSEPVYLTKNGEGDLVVMDIKAFEKRQRDLRVAEELMQIRNSRMNGAKTYTIDELNVFLTDAITKKV